MEIGLGEIPVVAPQVLGHIGCNSGNAVVARQVVIDLGIAGPVPGGPSSARFDPQCLGPFGVVSQNMSGEVYQQPAQVLDRQRLDNGRIGVDIPGPIDGDSTAFWLTDDCRRKKGARQIRKSRHSP
jgi:hypothetical protein